MNKTQTKALLKQQHLPVPAGTQVSLKQTFDVRSLQLNTLTGLVLKPAFGGSSLGLHIIANSSFILPAIEQIINDLGPIDILIEERINGPEFTVALIAGSTGLRALPPIAIVPHDGDYDFAAKYSRNDTLYQIVAAATDSTVGSTAGPTLVAQLQDLALRAAQACGCRDIARVDFMQDKHGALYILEINTLPGFTDHSLVPKAAAAAGIDFADLCLHLVTQAAQRQALDGAGEPNEK